MKDTHHSLRQYFRRRAMQIMRAEWDAGRRPTLEGLARLTLQATRPPYYDVDYDHAIHTLHKLIGPDGRSSFILPETERSKLTAGRYSRRTLWYELADRIQQILFASPEMRLGTALQKILTDSRPLRWHISLPTAIRWLS